MTAILALLALGVLMLGSLAVLKAAGDEWVWEAEG